MFWSYNFFFLLINNIRILLIIEKLPSRVHWGCTIGMYYGGTNQEKKEQRSRKIEKEEQEKWEKTTLHSKRVCKKKDLISSKKTFIALKTSSIPFTPNAPNQAMRH